MTVHKGSGVHLITSKAISIIYVFLVFLSQWIQNKSPKFIVMPLCNSDSRAMLYGDENHEGSMNAHGMLFHDQVIRIWHKHMMACSEL